MGKRDRTPPGPGSLTLSPTSKKRHRLSLSENVVVRATEVYGEDVEKLATATFTDLCPQKSKVVPRQAGPPILRVEDRLSRSMGLRLITRSFGGPDYARCRFKDVAKTKQFIITDPLKHGVFKERPAGLSSRNQIFLNSDSFDEDHDPTVLPGGRRRYDICELTKSASMWLELDVNNAPTLHIDVAQDMRLEPVIFVDESNPRALQRLQEHLFYLDCDREWEIKIKYNWIVPASHLMEASMHTWEVEVEAALSPVGKIVGLVEAIWAIKPLNIDDDLLTKQDAQSKMTEQGVKDGIVELIVGDVSLGQQIDLGDYSSIMGEASSR